MEEATSSAGSDDFGDLGFVHALELLLASCRETNTLTSLGWRVLHSSALRHLRNRLQLQAFLRARPGVADEPIPRAIVITGLPRTGTTLLQSLLAQDPSNRFLRLWEALRPLPPASTAERADRIERSRAWLERFYELVPGFRTIHPLTPEGPEECDALLQNSFASQHFEDMFDAPRYSDWLADADLTPEYSHYALQLRVLGSEGPETAGWVLKSQLHLGHLDAVLQALPGALVVQCHRDPIEAVASYASLISTLRRAYTVDVSAHAVGRQALRRCATALGRSLAVREGGADEAVIDVSYHDVVRDPLSVVGRIYRRAGRSLGAGAEARMRQWLSLNPKGGHGEHRYALAHFGLTKRDVEGALAPYMERLGARVHT
jgi:hypothetical protein